MKASSKTWLLVLVELSLFVVDHQQTPVLYVWHIKAPEIRVIGNIQNKRSHDHEKNLFPWKRNALPEPEQPLQKSKPQQQENKRDVSLEDILIEEDHKRLREGGKIKQLPHAKKKNHAKENKAKDLSWPAGTYGLPRAVSGCPSSSGFEWKTGFRFHDTEDDLTENQQSDSYHLSGKVSDDGIRQEFCMKTEKIGHKKWPEGKYCIYKKGSHCPDGLDSGFVIWDDENYDNKNSAGGTLPEGRYSEDTKIEFCCSTTGDWDQPIVLPTDRPFYLLAYVSNKCQKVANMNAVSESIKFDDEDRGNIDYEGGAYPYGVHRGVKDHMIFLCYYTPVGKVFDTIVEVAPMPAIIKTRHKVKPTSHKTKHKEKKKKIDKLEEMEKLRNSEKMMDAFLAVTSPHREETDKSERTKTIIKTIRVPERVKDSTTTIIATTMGIVLGAILLGSVILAIVSRHMRKRHQAKIDSMEEQTLTFTNSSRRSSFTTSDDEIDLTEGEYEDELVEDQYLPSDSELKSGLELMFLKQQRHYWTRNKKQ